MTTKGCNPLDSCQEMCFRSGKGTMSRCLDCGCWEMEYGNFRLSLDSDGASSLLIEVDRLLEQVDRGINPDQKIFFRVGATGVRFVLPAAELGHLRALLGATQGELIPLEGLAN